MLSTGNNHAYCPPFKCSKDIPSFYGFSQQAYHAYKNSNQTCNQG